MPPEIHSTHDANDSSDPVDSIAELLMGGSEEDSGDEANAEPTDEQTQDTDDVEDSDDAEEPSEESTEDEEVDESENDTDEEDDSLAAMLGIEENQLSVMDDGNFKINVKVNGKQGQVGLNDLIKGYQSESSNTDKSKVLAEERKAFETAATAKAQEINQSLERNINLAKVLEQEIMADFEKVDWDDLRQYDPAEWTAKRQEMSIKYNKIQRLQDELGQQATEATEAKIQATSAQQQEYLKGQWDTMIESNPSWSDTAKYKKDMATMKDFAAETYGFTDKDFNMVTDARLIELIKDAQSYRKGSQVAQKKIKIPVPKMQKRGKGGRFVKNKVSKLDKLTKAAKSAKGSLKRDLQRDAVAELLSGG